MPRPACVSLRWRSFYGRGWITQAAHLKKPRRGFFPRRTVRRVDAVRIHPHENSNLLQTENRQRISTLAVFLWARVDYASRAAKNSPPGCFCPFFCDGAAAVRIHPPSLREGYYKTETPVPGSDTGVLGGRGWIRTTEAEKQQIYSLSPLATREHAHIQFFAVTDCLYILPLGGVFVNCFLQLFQKRS